MLESLRWLKRERIWEIHQGLPNTSVGLTNLQEATKARKWSPTKACRASKMPHEKVLTDKCLYKSQEAKDWVKCSVSRVEGGGFLKGSMLNAAHLHIIYKRN